MTNEIKKLNKLTLKQNEFLKLYFETGNATRSAHKVYNTKDLKSASALASENLAKLRNPIKEYLEYRGLSIGNLVDVLIDGLKATKEHKEGSNKTKVIPDHYIRHKYLETAGKWLGIEDQCSKIQQNLFLENKSNATLMEIEILDENGNRLN